MNINIIILRLDLIDCNECENEGSVIEFKLGILLFLLLFLFLCLIGFWTHKFKICDFFYNMIDKMAVLSKLIVLINFFFRFY